MKRILALTLSLLITMGLAIPVTSTAAAGDYSIVSAGAYNQFTNYVDGYTMYVDASMSVDMSNSEVCAVLENNEKRIEIYKQSLAGQSFTGYINYSNRFLNDTADHVTDYVGSQKIGHYNCFLTSWHRNKLARVANDKNYYLVIDVPAGGYSYTIFVKASAPISDLGGYTYLVSNFSTFAPTTYGSVKKTGTVNAETRGWNDETKAFYEQYFVNNDCLNWGIFEPNTAMFDYTKLDSYEKYFDYQFPVLLNYSEFENTYKHPNLDKRLEMAYDHGKVLELTLQTSAKGGSNMIYDILNGTYDEFLKNYAKTIADFGHPVLFRPFNEMNGDWCPYSSYNTSRDTMIYKEVYKYLHKIFKKQGANNVIWVWNPNSGSFPDYKWNHTLNYYPGDKYVDVVGMTAYNTGTYYWNVGERWKEFDELYVNLYYTYNAWFGQPLMITEFASASCGGDKVQWVKTMFKSLKNFKQLKMAVWWDGCDWDTNGNIARSYFIDETPQLMEVFRRNLKKPWYHEVYA
ncbi:MAG: glycoside hydrolase family 26 protein [Clostridia bacterium]|nr:glycoside hydrolase family 26 protein [Clostridia bacterium]